MAGKTAVKKKCAPSEPEIEFNVEGLPQDIALMDDLIRKCYQELLKSVTKNVKIGDFMKMIEFRRRLAPADSAQTKFWAMLDKVRRDALGGEAKGKRALSAPGKKQ
jgi:hypothetical protein